MNYEEQQEETWFIWRNGKVGPLSSSHIIRLIQSSKLSPDDQISPAEYENWGTLGTFFIFPSGKRTNRGTGIALKKKGKEFNGDFKKWLQGTLQLAWKNQLVKILALIGVLPLLAVQLLAHSTLATITFWAFYFSVLWSLLAWQAMRPEKESFVNGIAVFLFTSLAGIPLLLSIQQLFFPRGLLSQMHELGFLSRALTFIFIVGISEEAIKVLPIWILLRKKGRQLLGKALIWLSLMSGFGFAIAENLRDYSMRLIFFNAAVATEESEVPVESFVSFVSMYGAFFSGQLVRLISLPILHAAWTGIVAGCVFYGYQSSQSIRYLVLGIIVAAFLHGLYNTFADSPLIGVAIAAFSLVLLAGMSVQITDRPTSV